MTQDEAGIVTKLSPLSVTGTVAKLTGMLSAKGVKLFAVIDQSTEARQAGLSLRETTLVIFGSPVAGTPVMAASPLAALDLPLKALVWDDDGQTKRLVLLSGRARRPPSPRRRAGREPSQHRRPHRRARRRSSRRPQSFN